TDCSTFFFFSSRRRHTRFSRDWSSDVCSSDLERTRREVEQREPQIVDRILSVMRQQTVTSVTGAEGQEKLRAEIVASVNDILVQGRVIQVWFTDLVVQ